MRLASSLPKTKASGFLAALAYLTDEGRIAWEATHPELNSCKLKTNGIPFYISFDFNEMLLTINATAIPLGSNEEKDMFELAQAIYQYHGRKRCARPHAKNTTNWRAVLVQACTLIEETEGISIS